MTAWRYIAQRVVTGEFLDWDLPIEVEETSWELSGPGALRGVVSPDVGQLRAADGDLLLQEWGTALYAEANGVIRWGGLVVSSSFQDEEWHVEAAGFSTYPHGIPYDDVYSKIQVDPAKAIKEVWRHLQQYVNGNLDVIVDADPTPVRLGTPAQPAYVEVYLDGAWQRSTDVPASRVLKDAESNLAADVAYNSTTLTVTDINTTQRDVDSVKAAQAILFRLANKKPLAADWTWTGMPSYVSAYHGALVAGWSAKHDPVTWLDDYIAGHNAKSKQTVAAKAIRDRIAAGLPVFEDWSWKGMPESVGTYNDALVDRFNQETTADTYLSGYIDRHSGMGSFSALPLPFTVTVGEEQIVVRGISGNSLTGCTRGANGTESAAHTAGTQVSYAGTKHRDVSAADADPYLLAWYEATDCGSEIDSLVSETPFDYAESHYWDGETIAHRIRYGYPRLGRRRDDLAFVQGDNVTSVVTVESTGDDYANTVVGIGSGEGRKTIRSDVAVDDGRLRRVAVYSDKAVSKRQRLDSLTKSELNRRSGLLQITSVDVVDHPNAPFGSWDVGDDVLIRATVPWLGDVDLWCRITGWSLTGEETATLALARSDSYTYGGSTQ